MAGTTRQERTLDSEAPKDQVADPAASRPAARWNIVSLLAPVAGGFLLGMLAPRHEMAWGLASAAWLIFGCGGGGIVGVVAALIALFRGERHGVLTALGLLINLPLAGLLLILAFN